ncbi:MAG: hypothetical protein NTW14_11710 [bacterium]|nr:hypothetical protein [bacterium]
MQSTLRVLIWSSLIIIAVSHNPAAAQQSWVGTPFLQYEPTARSSGLGGAFTACADDASATWWNPGGLAFLKGGEAIFTYFDLLPLDERNIISMNLLIGFSP